MNKPGYLQTGQITCHDATGRDIPCFGSGQDGEFRKGFPWSVQRLEPEDDIVLDRLTGLTWAMDANLTEFPVTWQEALDYIKGMNRSKASGLTGWRLPNRRELMSHQAKKPVLPEGHPFRNVFPGWYWTSTTAAINTAYAWYIHMEGARMFYGNKEQFFLLWPVRGKGYGVLPATGQTRCYDASGAHIPCSGTGQDGEFLFGMVWPSPRFEVMGDDVIDRLTGLCWLRTADLTGRQVTWSQALAVVADFNQKAKGPAVLAASEHQRAGIPRGLQHTLSRAAGRKSVQGCEGRILVIHYEHVRARLGVGLVPQQRGCRGRTEIGGPFFRMGGMRHS